MSEYATRLLLGNLPKMGGAARQGSPAPVGATLDAASVTANWASVTSGLLSQMTSSILKDDSGAVKLTETEQVNIVYVVATVDGCLIHSNC